MFGTEAASGGAAAFLPTSLARNGLGTVAAVGAVARLAWAARLASEGDLDGLTRYGFTVVLPLVVTLLVLSMGEGRTSEGVLMRLATAAQMVLIIAIPHFALHLLLGLPVAFLIVELFETRLPEAIRQPIERSLVAC